MKYNRNDPCWCGSGKKYKKCHYGREDETPDNPFVVFSKLKKGFSKKYCMHPDAPNGCEGKIVKAHSIQKSRSLKSIARNGHVLRYDPSVEMLDMKGVPHPKESGINTASTFTGFCAHHDQATFSIVEQGDFVPSEETCTLAGYRQLCRELFAKRASLESYGDIRKSADRGKSLQEQRGIQERIEIYRNGLRHGIKTLQVDKAEFDIAITANDFSDFRYYVVEFEHTPQIMCSAFSSVEVDFEANKLQRIGDITKRLFSISLSIFSDGKRKFASFVWNKTADRIYVPFIQSLHRIPDDEITNALIRYVFLYSDNMSIAPDWWIKMKGKRQTTLNKYMLFGTPMHLRITTQLMDNGLGFDNWGVVGRTHNLPDGFLAI